MLGLFSPAAGLIMMMFGLIVIFMLGLFSPISLTFVIIAGVLSVIIGFKVKQ